MIYESYSKLSSTACELSQPSRILSIYVRLILFLTLLLKAKDICNVSWSFYTFECMTSYIKFLGRDANDIINCMDDTYCASFADCGSAQKEKDLKKKISIFLEEKLTEDPLREEICAYAEKIVNEFWSISNNSTKEFPYSFACFVLNLKLACSSDAEDFFESDEGMKDPLWGPYVIENMRATYLTELSRLTSVTAKSCSPLADEFVKRLCQEDLKQENSKNTI